MIPFENAPLTGFHRRVGFAGAFGQFADAYSVGAIGIVVLLAKVPLGLTSWSMGALGAASLFGLFFGNTFSGNVADRIGRRPIFKWGMLAFTILAIWQFLASSFYELLALRILLGVVLGGDYTSSKTLVTEYLPTRHRGPFLSLLGIAWAAGYASAYFVGYLLRDTGGDAWRYILLSCALPSALVFLFRLGIPESVPWLLRKGKVEKAREIVSKHLGPDIALPAILEPQGTAPAKALSLFEAPYFRYLVFGTLMQCSFVIPFYALGTFLPLVMSKLGVGDGYTGALIFNTANLIGAFLGIFFIDRLPRRTLLLGSLISMAVLLLILTSWQSAPDFVIVTLFTLFAFIVASGGLLAFIYPAELFPTELRARGIGTIGGVSRIGTATTTFLLPAVVNIYSAQAAIGFCAVFLIFSTAACYKMAPETLGKAIR